MLRQTQGLMAEFGSDKENKDDKPEPDALKLKVLGEKLKAMQNEVITSCKQTDKLTGQVYVRADDEKYKVMLSKVNDRFRMEEGYDVEYISELIKRH